MKTNSIGKRGFALFFAFLLAGCSFFPPDAPGKPATKPEATPEMTPETTEQREFLAVLKAAGNFIIDKAELEQQIFQLLNPQTAGRSVAPGEQTVITGSKKLSLPGLNVSRRAAYARSAADEQPPVDVYVFSTENAAGTEGYVLASNDMRTGTILAVVDGGSLEDQAEWFTDIIFDGLANYIDYTLELYDSISEEELPQLPGNAAPRAAVSRAAGGSGATGFFTSGKGLTHHFDPNAADLMLVSYSWTNGYEYRVPANWHQNDPYNYYVCRSRNSKLDDYVTGCGPTALAQLMAYHGHPLKCKLNVTIPNENLNINNYAYNWASMRNDFGTIGTNATSISSGGARDIAVLMYEIGLRTNAKYTKTVKNSSGTKDGSTSTSDSGMMVGLWTMGYNTPDSFFPYNFTMVQLSLITKMPVIMGGYSNSTLKTGHYWIIDGVRKMTYTEHLVDGSKREWSNKDFVHCNVGWGESYNNLGRSHNAWYISGIFDFREDKQSRVRSAAAFYYQYDLRILPFVSPN